MNPTRRGFLGAAAPLILASPALACRPTRDDNELKGWGTVVDPDGDCQFEAASGALRITVPASLHDLSAEQGKVNAPRVMREVEGDFLIDVRVDGGIKPAGPCTRPSGLPYSGAGVLVWLDEKNYIRLERAAVERDGKNAPYVNFEERHDGQRRGTGANVPETATYLRLERRGDQLIGAFGPDGLRWTPLPPFSIAYPQTIRVGVAAISSSSQRFAAQLDALRLLVTAR
jgi:regulation of enolase protein 1 (concanavalin A-like superfamily)